MQMKAQAQAKSVNNIAKRNLIFLLLCPPKVFNKTDQRSEYLNQWMRLDRVKYYFTFFVLNQKSVSFYFLSNRKLVFELIYFCKNSANGYSSSHGYYQFIKLFHFQLYFSFTSG